MIIDEIVLENFGAYGGRQAIQLTPKGKKRCVTVIGALNGRGKTTMLDALNLALYGNRANLSNRGNLSYDTYLARARNRKAGSDDPFAVEVAFTVQDTQGEVSYRVRRAWRTAGRTSRELLDVTRDGVRDRALTETWAEHIEELLPLEISSLFFFDGEKVEQLADPTQASQVISAALTGLLGLGVIERLQRDLQVIERRKQDEAIPEEDRSGLEALDQAVVRADEVASLAAQRRAEEQNSIDRIERELGEAEAQARSEGGDLFERRHELELSRSKAEIDVTTAEGHLRELASTSLPLGLCGDLIEGLAAARTAAVASGPELVEFLRHRDQDLLERIKERFSSSDLEFLGSTLLEDREARVAGKSAATYEPAISSVRSARTALEMIRSERPELAEALEERNAAAFLVADFDRQLAGVPTEESISSVLAERGRLKSELDQATGRMELRDEELLRAEKELEAAKAVLEKERQALAMTQVQAQDALRTIEHSTKVRTTLDLLKAEVRARSIASIEAEVVSCFKKLLGKENFISHLHLDPETCTPTLTNKEGQQLHLERLSAGERQLFATSMLWGLAKVSGRSLPTIIDTPLGRLDGPHRTILVERYFPKAANQVILLSTDEEINEKFVDLIEPSVGRWYQIVYDDEAERSTVEDGYFFEETKDVA